MVEPLRAGTARAPPVSVASTSTETVRELAGETPALHLPSQPRSQRPDVGRVTPAAPAGIPDPFIARRAPKFEKFSAPDLDGFQVIRKGRLPGEGMAFLGGPEGRGLGRQWKGRGLAHLPEQRQHPPRFLFAIGPYGEGATVGQGARALGWSMPIAA